jgi:hypothetical protein
LTSRNVNGAKISLWLFLINNWHFYSFILLAPNIATDISPKKMTFILKKLPIDLIRFHYDELLAIGSILWFFFLTSSGSVLGLRF